MRQNDSLQRLLDARRTISHGFTLIEIMISLTILASIVSLLLTIFANGVKQASDGESAGKAMIYAQSKMDEILLAEPKKFNDIKKSGTFKNSDFSFRIETKPQSSPGKPRKVALQHVQLSVFWDNGDGERDVVLEALKWVPNDDNAPGQ